METPPVSADLQEVGPRRSDRVDRGLRARVRSTAVNPFREVRYDLRLELRALLWHLQRLMGMIHGLEQDALLGVAWDDGGAFFAALE